MSAAHIEGRVRPSGTTVLTATFGNLKTERTTKRSYPYLVASSWVVNSPGGRRKLVLVIEKGTADLAVAQKVAAQIEDARVLVRTGDAYRSVW